MDKEETKEKAEEFSEYLAKYMDKKKISPSIAITVFLNFMAMVAVKEDDSEVLIKTIAKGLGECYRAHLADKNK